MATTKANAQTSETQSPAGISDRPPSVRAVLLLARNADRPASSRRPDAETRQRILAERQAAVRAALSAVDATLQAAGGRRLGEPTGLGSVLVETSSDGLQQLKDLPQVRAVLNDQPVRPAD